MRESLIDEDFLNQLNAAIEANISNEQFGVSELAHAMSMSRSNLLRKITRLTKLSVSQYIRQVRLKRAMQLLKETSSNVSEVSFKTGFGSTSYFIKCFREYYGYPPGEVGKRGAAEPDPVPQVNPAVKRNFILLSGVAAIVVLVVGMLFYYNLPGLNSPNLEKSIAVLPFKNDSNDSTNVYLINGLMESTLNNLQKIKELKVTSRTSAEKYRNTTKSIPEMGRELNVSYIVEGSGQKIGDQILLNIQLIDAATDRHLWARQYRREATDIFELQQEIAKNIAEEIEVIITPEEVREIEEKPTDDLVAYDFYLKGRDLFYESTGESLFASIPWFTKAVERDAKFALAYANMVMVYYYLDIFHIEKQYTTEVNTFADKALLLNPGLSESMIAKALAYAHAKEYQKAVPYLEKAFEYSPNSGLVVHFLTEFYSMYVPDPANYLKYALKGVEIDIAATDSATLSFKYFHLSNAFMQAGFVDESLQNMEKSMAYNPNNPFARYVSVLFRYAKNDDRQLTRALLEKEFEKDTSRMDVVKEVAKICYVMKDYESAHRYYSIMVGQRERLHLDLFREEDLSVGFVLTKLGREQEATRHFESFREFASNDQTIYRHMLLALWYAQSNDVAKSIEHMELFSKEENFSYWVLLLEEDPIMESVKGEPGFKKVMDEIKAGFWKRNREIRESLEAQGLTVG